MYLKEIVIAGFKSFADKININLDDDITCIVGPNGSGKSNVVDAVRWVLGEQSVKQLRGDNLMSDVIFSGSKSRNALNVASVSLIFDNTDNYLNIPFTEVEIKRKVYRSGENEYYINNEKCRLKDITSLLIDSGIAKESFNIISQGEVQKILNDSPQDLRIIFEEAAGVLKYKKRKEEALRKLDKTNNNLDRVDDILLELESQLTPLKEQSLKAKEYLENKNNLEKIEVALLVYEIDTINQKYKHLKEEIELINKRQDELNKNINNSELEEEVIKTKILSLENAIKIYQKEIIDIVKETEEINTEKKLLQERRKYDSKDSKVYENIKDLKEKKKYLENDKLIKEKKLKDSKDKFIQDEIFLKKTEEEINNIKNKKDLILRNIQYESKQKIELDSKISVLNNNIEFRNNLSSSIKAIINNPKLDGIHDVFSNLVNTESKYLKALEVAISSSRNYLIVDNEVSAKYAIKFIKDNNLGRTTFYPLSIIKKKSVDFDTLKILKNNKDFIDVFSNIVTYDKLYTNIVENLLGNVLLVRDIDSANQISKMINYRYKIVTLDGEVFNVGGSITGGSINSKSSISDKYELDKLKISFNHLLEKLDNLDMDIKNINNELYKKEEMLYKLKTNLNLLKDKCTNDEGVILNISKDISNIDKELSSLNSVINNDLEKLEDSLIEKYYSRLNLKEEKEYELNEKIKEKDILQSKLSEIEALNKVNSSNLKKEEKELQEKSISLNKMDMILDNCLNIINNDYEITFEYARDNYYLDIDYKDAKDKVNIYKNNIKRIGMVNLDSIDEFEKINSRYTFLSNQKNDLDLAKTRLNEIIGEMDNIMKSEFLISFDKIKHEFENVFRHLFNGGRASLELTDKDNILTTGVTIIASPPGKKLTTISLLSGGEKTLTAISLLFAMLNVRVVPFCIFDEVEAALDEANVDNFGRYLEQYKNKTQFLLITHKKKTMEYAHSLYGITMQESGVSKLVSVKLEK